MSTKKAIWNAAVTALKAGTAVGHPLAFMKSNSVFEGLRTNIPQGAYPAIVLEPDNDSEANFTEPNGLKSLFRVFVTCQVYHTQFDKGIIGDSSVTGILDFVDAVKNVLQADQTLGALVGQVKIKFPETTFFFESYPIREAKIIVEFTNILTATTH